MVRRPKKFKRDMLSAMFSIVRSTPVLFQYVRSMRVMYKDLLDIVNGLGKMRLSAPVADCLRRRIEDRGLSV